MSKEYTPQADVAEFMTMCGQDVATSPSIAYRDILLLRCKLTFEETKEFIEAAGCFIGMNEEGEFDIFEDPNVRPNLVGMYDGICDINYVNYGAANALGLNVQKGHEEVHRSNMSKRWDDGTIHKNEFGKVIKSTNYSPANLAKVIAEQEK